MTATDLAPTTWHPDERQPASVDAEWYPAKSAREDTPAAGIHAVTLRPGGSVAIGAFRVTVTGLLGATAGGGLGWSQRSESNTLGFIE